MSKPEAKIPIEEIHKVLDIVLEDYDYTIMISDKKDPEKSVYIFNSVPRLELIKRLVDILESMKDKTAVETIYKKYK